MRSILQVDEDICYLCGRSGAAMDWHHCFGGSARHASEAYGLKVRLCHMGCHMYGKNAVHDNQAVMDELHREAQKKRCHITAGIKMTLSGFLEKITFKEC